MEGIIKSVVLDNTKYDAIFNKDGIGVCINCDLNQICSSLRFYERCFEKEKCNKIREICIQFGENVYFKKAEKG